MTSLEKFNQLVEIDQKKGKAKITTVRGEVYYCKPLGFAEDEDDWAYDFFTPDYPTKYFVLDCNFINTIEEVDEDEWKQHLRQKRRPKNLQTP